MGVHVPPGAAFYRQEHVLGPAVHQAVQEPLGSCGESLGESTGESGIPGKPPLLCDREIVLLF